MTTRAAVPRLFRITHGKPAMGRQWRFHCAGTLALGLPSLLIGGARGARVTSFVADALIDVAWFYARRRRGFGGQVSAQAGRRDAP